MMLSFLAPALRLLKGIPWEAWAAVALFAAFWWWGNHQYQSGKHHERAAWEQRVADIRAERDAAMAKATDTDTDIAEGGEQAIADRRKELDDAKANLPDQGLTDRQRARRCAELRRQGSGC